MAHNQHGWYNNDNRSNRQQGPSQNTVHDAQRLLSAYPLSSTTPSTHVARHLDHLSVNASAPSFMNPSYYSNHPMKANTQQQPPPPYTEYAPELSYMAGPASSNDNGYWRQTATNAVRLVQDQAGPSYPYPPASNNLWPASNYSTSQMAQTMFHHTQAASAYPTPPPLPSSSSSSLAGALGPAPSSAPIQRRIYPIAQSGQFFDDFLSRKTREMSVAEQKSNINRALTLPRTSIAASESPDPLALKSRSSELSPFTTPRKRKPVVELSSPSIKKRHFGTEWSSSKSQRPTAASIFGLDTPSSTASPVPMTPSSTASTSVTPSTNRSVRKTLTLDHVEVPPQPWLTPVSSRKKSISSPSILNDEKTRTRDESPDDLGGYGTEEDSPSKGRSLPDAGRSTARRGTTDVAFQKLTSLIDDIFTTEDSLPAEAESSDLPTHYFSVHSPDFNRPSLNAPTIRKLTQYISNVSKPIKRGATGTLATPRHRGGRMAEVDTLVLSRLLRTLARSVKAGEDLDPFVVSQQPSARATTPKSPSKKGKKKLEDGEPDQDGQDQGPSEIELEIATRILEIAKDSVLAAECCLALLGSDRLPKQLYSEEIITSCLNASKNELTKIIYPFVEASSETNTTSIPGSSILHHIVKHNSPQLQTCRKLLAEMFQALSAILPRINILVGSESIAMSEAIVIQSVYIAIGPFFIDGEGGQEGRGKKEKEGVVAKTFGKSAIRGLRLHALSLLREIFAHREDQRSWIIEEILSSLIKLSDSKQKAGQFRLRDGRSIRTISALLLQLVQTSSHDVRLQAKKITKQRQQAIALKTQTSFTEMQKKDQPFLEEHDHDEIRMYDKGLDSATKAAKTIIMFLTQRSGKNKATKNSNEAEYRNIFDNLMSDLLVVLFWPEWPAASLILSIACKVMLSALDDKASQSDNNAAKTMALDHLGVIAAKIRLSHLKFQETNVENEKSRSKVLKPLDEITKKAESRELGRYVNAYQDVAAHLTKRATEDQAYASAQELSAASFGHDLAAALKGINDALKLDDEDVGNNLKLRSYGDKLKDAMRDVWKDHSNDVFDVGSQEDADRVDRIAEEMGSMQMMKVFFQHILNVILSALDASPIFMRTKALRALGQIVTSDATILSTVGVRRAIESRLLDGSPAVRDAAVELIGKYMIDAPEVASHYYPKIADRIADTGLSVRKRVIKLLKTFYQVTEDVSRQIDIATRLVLRMLDEDDTVKELAIKSIEELWFPNASPSVLASPSKRSAVATQESETSPVKKVAIIMGVSANFKERQSPLEDLLHTVMADKEGNEAAVLHSRYTEMCGVLIDGLVDASDLPGFTTTNCIRTINLLVSAYPAVITSANASTLLPYLKSPTNASVEEQSTADHLLKIFRASIPHMPKTATKFGQELQALLQPMIIKPTGGISALQETVACICVVVQNLTHDYGRLIALLKSCNARLQDHLKRSSGETLPPNVARALVTLIGLISLLAEHCNFDELRTEHPSLAPSLNAISPDSIMQHIYNSLLRMHQKFDDNFLRPRVLQCLGFLFRAQPTLMTLENSAAIMDSIFASPEEDDKARLLKIIQDFLVSESVKHTAKQKDGTKRGNKPTNVNMDELIGNTDGFADSGVASAVVQRYLTHILAAALSPSPQVQGPAIDILAFTIKQGLAHPLQSFPVIVALESSPQTALSNRASALHAILHGKHASLLNTRYIISAKASFEIPPSPTRGRAPALFSLVREKRQPKLDFLKSLIKVFQENPSHQSSQEEIDFARYMAENFASFDYKTQEEVFTIIKFLTSVLSTAGTHVLELVSPSHLLASLRASSKPISTKADKPPSTHSDSEVQKMLIDDHNEELAPMEGVESTNVETKPQTQVDIGIIRTSVIISIVMLLKAHLKSLYGLSEEKCSKFVLGKKSAVGDKATTKKHDKPISWERLPFATKPILTMEDQEAQKTRFLEIWNEDGVTDEPEDDILS